MAGRILKKQYAIIGFAIGIVDMMWNQRYRHQRNNTTFRAAKDRIHAHGDRMHDYLRSEGALTPKDIIEIKRQIDELKIDHLPGGQFEAMLAISFSIDLIVEQIALTSRRKRELFDGLLIRMREFERYFDRKKTYDDPAAMEMADKFRELVTV